MSILFIWKTLVYCCFLGMILLMIDVMDLSRTSPIEPMANEAVDIVHILTTAPESRKSLLATRKPQVFNPRKEIITAPRVAKLAAAVGLGNLSLNEAMARINKSSEMVVPWLGRFSESVAHPGLGVLGALAGIVAVKAAYWGKMKIQGEVPAEPPQPNMAARTAAATAGAVGLNYSIEGIQSLITAPHRATEFLSKYQLPETIDDSWAMGAGLGLVVGLEYWSHHNESTQASTAQNLS